MGAEKLGRICYSILTGRRNLFEAIEVDLRWPSHILYPMMFERKNMPVRGKYLVQLRCDRG